MAKKINSLDRRWASALKSKVEKIDRLLSEVEKMLKAHAKIEPVSKNIEHAQSARASVAALAAFAFLAKEIVRHTDEVRQ